MNTLHNVGKQVSSFELYDQLDPITGIWLFVGENRDEDLYKAGNETGTVLEVYCPYGNQTMANTLLSQLQGQVYAGFRAQNAVLSPAAELGDWVTVNGGTYMLAYRSINFGPGHMAEIAAPGESTQEHEYGWTSPETRKTTYNQARSMISKTNKEIQLAIYGEDGKGGLNGRMNTFTMGLSGISGQIDGYQETLNGYSQQLVDYKYDLDGYSLDLKQYSKDVAKNTEETASYKMAVEGFEARVGTYEEQAGKTQEAYSLIDQKVNNLKLAVSKNGEEVFIQLKSGDDALGTPGTISMAGLVTFDSLKAGGTTQIDGSRITTGTISADRLALTEAITWDDLSVGCKAKVGDGLTVKDVTTYIDSSLVSSPTIAGGVYQDESKKPDAKLHLDKEYDGDEIVNAGLVLERNIYSYKSNGDKNKLVDTLQTLQIWDSGQDMVSFLSRDNLFLYTLGGVQTYCEGTWYFTGTVDFSGANVKGL